MRRCSEMELMMQDYLDGYLLAGQRRALDEHLGECPSCRTLLGEMRSLDAGLEGVDPVEAPPGLGAAILDRLPAAPSGPPARHPAPARVMLAAAMVALVIGSLAGGLAGRFTQGRAVATREVEMVFHSPGASSVAVVGDFNGWDPERTPMERRPQDGLWRARLRLLPGVYEYGFLVDGREWTSDPSAERSVADGFGSSNSVIFIDG